jgi:hypothetical protein
MFSSGTNPYPNVLNRVQVWRGLPDLAVSLNLKKKFKFCSWIVTEHFPHAMWQPLIRPHGGLSLGHVVPFQVIMTCQHATSAYRPYRLSRGTIRLVHGST